MLLSELPVPLQDLYRAITGYQIANDGFSPSLAEIAVQCKVRSENTIVKRLKKLEELGVFTPNKKHRGFKLTLHARRQLVAKWGEELRGVDAEKIIC